MLFRSTTFDLGLADPVFAYLDDITSSSGITGITSMKDDSSITSDISNSGNDDLTVKDIFSVNTLLALRQDHSLDIGITTVTISDLLAKSSTVKDTADPTVISDSVNSEFGNDSTISVKDISDTHVTWIFTVWMFIISLIAGLIDVWHFTLVFCIRACLTVKNFCYKLKLPKGFLSLCIQIGRAHV